MTTASKITEPAVKAAQPAAEAATRAAQKAAEALHPLVPHAHEAVSGGVTAFFGFLLLLMIVALALEEKLHAKKSVIVGVFAFITLFLGTLFGLEPFGDVVLSNGDHVSMPVYIPAVDWQVIAIILGSGVFADVISRSGVFSWIAIKLTKISRGDPLLLLWCYGIMTVLFSAVLNNVTAMIIVGSLTVVSLSKLEMKYKLAGFLLVEGLLTNIGGLLTLISSVPNIIVGGTAGISFIDFFLKAAPFVLVSTILTVFMGSRIFGIRRLAAKKDKEQARLIVSGFDENDGVESKGFFWFSAFSLLGFILTIAFTPLIPGVAQLGMGFVALSFAMMTLLRFKHDVDKFYQAVDWDLIGFFIGLFIVISVMEHAQVLAVVGKAIGFMISGGADVLGKSALLTSSAVVSSVVDNIPLSAVLTKILAAMHTPSDSDLWWAVVFGANLGGILTPIGSASTLVAVTIMHRHEVGLSFGGYIKKVMPFAIAQIGLAIAYVLIS
ncbi:MAG: hypothetical protein GC185_02525 [Alphaproteobacteria bacterium]|nr:hypothetical protein [Alphaproteobacteria bacterium]